MSKFSSQQCLEHLITQLAEHPEWIHNQIQLVTSEQIDKFRNELWPACLNPDCWQRTATLRPSRDPESQNNSFMGSDMEIRVYENEMWYPRLLKAEVITEFGSFKDIKVTLV